MPGIDGLKLAREILTKNPNQLILIVSAYLNKKIATKIAESGVDYILEKPVNKENFLDTINFILSKKREDHSITGIVNISLPTLLSILGYEKGSAAIKVFSDGKEGIIYIKDGYLIKSVFDGKKNIEAVKEILSLNSYYYEQIPFSEVEEETNIPIEFILMESSRQLDEEKINMEETASTDSPDVMKSEGITHMLNEIFVNSVENGAIFPLKSDIVPIYSKGERGENFKDFLSIFSFYRSKLRDKGLPSIDKYMIINLANGNILILILNSSFFAGFEINLKKVELGYILNVSLPEFIEKFQDII